MTNTFWNFADSPWTIFAAIVIMAITLCLSYMNIKRSDGGLGMWLLESLRVLIIGLLLFTLFRPEFVRSTNKLKDPLVAVLFDSSKSMTTRDVVQEGQNPLTRKDWISLQKTNAFWKPLEEQYKVVLEDFSPPPLPRETKPESKVKNEKPDETVSEKKKSEAEKEAAAQATASIDDAGTDINQALDGVLNKYKDLRAVLLLSDGDWNQGKSPVFAATKMRVKGVNIFAVTVGSDYYLPDLEVKNVSAPAYGLMDEHISIPFTIQSRLPEETKTTVSLMGPRGIEKHKEITIPAMGEFQDSIVLTPKVQGEFNYTLRMPVEKEEAFSDNNEKSFLISIRRELLKVLVVDTSPRWEYRFLHNALSRDPGVMVSCYLKHPGMALGGGRNYLNEFPRTREELSKYDVVFLGDVGLGAEGLTKENGEMIKGLVEQQGSGLVFLPGMKGNQTTLIDSDLGEMLPVVLDQEHRKGFGFYTESKLSLTARGRGHLLTMLSSDPRSNTEIWKSLPGFYWHAQVVKAKLGTDVLATHATARNSHGRIPLLVTRTYGNGKVLFMGTDSAWRWRRGVEDTYHYRFWGQVVRWMAHQRHLSHQEGIRFFYNPEAPKRNDRVFLHATVFDQSGFPVKDGKVKATITAESGHVEEVTMNQEPGGWGVFTSSFVPQEGGAFNVTIVCKEAGRELVTQVMVDSPKRERVGRPARAATLKEIVQLAGGKAGGPADLEEIVQSMSLLPEVKPIEQRFRLWSHPLWATLLVGLLAVYWVGRKLSGLI